jgi:hypothetical protein
MGFGLGSIGKAVGGLLGGGGGDQIGAMMGGLMQNMVMQGAQEAFQMTEKSMQENFKKDKERQAEMKKG